MATCGSLPNWGKRTKRPELEVGPSSEYSSRTTKSRNGRLAYQYMPLALSFGAQVVASPLFRRISVLPHCRHPSVCPASSKGMKSGSAAAELRTGTVQNKAAASTWPKAGLISEGVYPTSLWCKGNICRSRRENGLGGQSTFLLSSLLERKRLECGRRCPHFGPVPRD